MDLYFSSDVLARQPLGIVSDRRMEKPCSTVFQTQPSVTKSCKEDSKVAPLNLQRSLELFMVLGVGFALSLVAFVVELD